MRSFVSRPQCGQQNRYARCVVAFDGNIVTTLPQKGIKDKERSIVLSTKYNATLTHSFICVSLSPYYISAV